MYIYILILVYRMGAVQNAYGCSLITKNSYSYILNFARDVCEKGSVPLENEVGQLR